MEKLQYPIGQYVEHAKVSAKLRGQWISDIEMLPLDLENIVIGLDQKQLDQVYRPGGWTLRQVVHHLADSHLNAYLRFKLALTLDNPRIVPYPEAEWAEIVDGKNGPIKPSLNILKGIHHRWVICLKNISESDWSRTFFHPEHNISFRLDTTLGMYAWHGRHHLAHIENAL